MNRIRGEKRKRSPPAATSSIECRNKVLEVEEEVLVLGSDSAAVSLVEGGAE